MRQLAKVAGAFVALIALGVLVAWATSPDPRFNPATFEGEPLTDRKSVV